MWLSPWNAEKPEQLFGILTVRIRSVLNANDGIQLIARKQWVIALPFLGYAPNNQSANPCTIGILYTFWGFCSPCICGSVQWQSWKSGATALSCAPGWVGVEKGAQFAPNLPCPKYQPVFLHFHPFFLLFNHSQGWLAFCLTCLHYTLLQSIWQAGISRRRHVLLSARAGGREGDQASQLQPQPGRQTEIQPKKPPSDAWVLFPLQCPLLGSHWQVKVFIPFPLRQENLVKLPLKATLFLQWWKERVLPKQKPQEWGTRTFTLRRTVMYGCCWACGSTRIGSGLQSRPC